MRPKAIPDTSFLIEHFRTGNVQKIFLEVNRNYKIVFNSVVLMELFSGAYEKKDRRLVEYIRDNFEVITPTENEWYKAGDVLMKLRRDKKVDPLRIKCLLTDVLIALSARSTGALLITKDEKDFKLIHEVTDFKYIAV
ncbi:MAG: type II toxin-antitoxin system VapC family toxin [Nitrospirota bacterium]